ncbi:MAG: glycine--tRNA ligase subunit beta [Bradymonadales bacterium]
MSKTLLFELICEDLPARQIDMAINSLTQSFIAACKEARIVHGKVKNYATPRRLALQVHDIAEYQEELSTLRVGPAVSAARDKDGNLTPAAKGFLKSIGADESQIQEVVQEKKKGKPVNYIAVQVKESSEYSAILLPKILENSLKDIHWAKPMRWGSQSIEFARPVHRIVALLDDVVLPVQFAGIEASNLSTGHRFMAKRDIALTAQSDYVGLLREHFVLVDIDERRKRVMQEAKRVADSVGGTLIENDELLDEVVHILEWPVGIIGNIDEEFLKLPREVLETSMCKHQRYFSLVDNAGNLMPHFVTLSNTDVADPSVVSRGNERVLRARLKDAEFFFAEDQRIALEKYNEKLRRVRYVEGMGTVFERSTRMRQIAKKLADFWTAPDVNVAEIDRAAQLCKADLATGMVGEFPELQGIMGSIYALSSKESSGVSLAIREHYAPRHANDSVAQSSTGAIVAVAEKIDSIVALFALNRIPTGTADPFALRRAAVGLLRTLAEHKQRFALLPIIEAAIDAVYKTRASLPEEKTPLSKRDDILKNVLDFCSTRLRYMLAEHYAAQIVDSVVLNTDLADIPAILGRVEALAAQRETPEFASLIAIFKRVSNILRQANLDSPDVSPELFETDEEREFYQSAKTLKSQYSQALHKQDYEAALALLAQLREPADRFFDAVLVNCEDEAVRLNRYALLSTVEAMFTQFADVRRL